MHRVGTQRANNSNYIRNAQQNHIRSNRGKQSTNTQTQPHSHFQRTIQSKVTQTSQRTHLRKSCVRPINRTRPFADTMVWRADRRHDHLRTVWLGELTGGTTICGQFGVASWRAARPFADSLAWRASRQHDHLRTVWFRELPSGTTICGQFGLAS